jgi:putative tryptophan/tyrosine transport system substrate-binding protein
MRRRAFLTLLSGATASAFHARAQQPKKLARIGFLGPGPSSTDLSARSIAAFRAGLRDLGHMEGQNIVIEFRWAENDFDRLPELAAELVRLNVDLLVTYALPGVLAAKQATTTIPIVMAISAEPIRLGLVTSLNRPGGNLTGNSFFNPELNAKRLELLKEALPASTRFAVLLNPNNQISPGIFEAMALTAKSLNVELQQFEAHRPDEFASAFAAMAVKKIEAAVVVDDPMITNYAGSIVELAMAPRLPLIGSLEIAEAGGLMAYGVDFLEMWRHAAVFVDKILKGATPDQLPVEQPTKFKFVINLKTATALGLTLPNLLFARADEVIE